MLPAFSLRKPTTVTEALRCVSEESVPYAGGTELLLAMKMGLLRPLALVDLKGLATLRDIRVEGDALHVGAATTHMTIARSPLVRTHAPLLSSIAAALGNPRVRSQGTIGGNLCFAEPKSDVATILMALRASVVLETTSGTRTLLAEDFVQGPYWTVRDPQELMVAVRIPLVPTTGVYLKHQTMERPTVGVALTWREDAGYRLVVGAACEVPTVFDLSTRADVNGDDIAAAVDPIADLAGSQEYKRHVTATYVRRALQSFRESAFEITE